MRVDTMILAGAANTGRLKDLSLAPNEALIEIGGKPMLDYILTALAGANYGGRVVIVGPPADFAGRYPQATLVPSGDSILENVRRGAEALIDADRILIVTSDIPMLTAASVTDFLQRCATRDADFHYPVVSQAVSDGAYPGVKRTYVTLKDGTFTGGNIFLVRAEKLLSCLPKAAEFIKLRKKPLQLAGLLGIGFILKFLTHSLSIAAAERRVSQLLGLRGAAIITPFAEIGVDVDKPSDLALAESVLAKKA